MPITATGSILPAAAKAAAAESAAQAAEKAAAELAAAKLAAAAEAHVNMMDFRVGNETLSWMQNLDLVREFVEKGGYRLYPSSLSLPVSAVSGSSFIIDHTWENLGWGYCPNNIRQWNYRYKPAFSEDGTVVKVFVDTDAEPSEWLKDAPMAYHFEASLDGIPPGKYKWAVGIVDTTRDNTIGINLSLPDSVKTDAGWAVINRITIY